MPGEALLIVHNYALRHNRVRLELDVLAEAGMDVDVICLRDEGEPRIDRYRTARIHRLPVRRHRGASLPVYLFEYLSFFLLATLQAAWLHIRRRYDMVIVHSLPDPLVFTALVPRLMGAPLVFNMREFTPELIRTRYKASDKHPLVVLGRILEAASCRFANQVITVHDAGADLLAKRGVPRQKLHVIVNTTDLPVEAIESHRNSGRDSGPFTLLYHGTAGNEYDLRVVVEAMALLRARGRPRVALRIVGDGPELPRVRARAAELGLETELHFEPPVPFAEIASVIASADAGVALMQESPYAQLGVPTKLLECVACGVPVLSTPGAAILRYFPDDQLWYVPFGDASAVAGAIERMMDEPALAAEKARRAAASLRPLLLPRMRERFRALVDQLVQPTRRLPAAEPAA